MNKIIKIYKIKSFAFTPFCNDKDINYLKMNGVEITENINEADILISQNLKHLKPYFWRYYRKKKFLVWTLEPRFDTSFKSCKKFLFGKVKCHFMNIYTGDVFTTGLAFHAHHINKILIPLEQSFKLQNYCAVALMSYFKGVDSPRLIRNGVNIDLIKLRSEIAIYGQSRGLLDIYGKGWPNNLSIEDSRQGDWKLRKFQILNKYSFNLCFENTISPNYITEKIWDSLENYCLPIYYGKGNGIYNIFPKNSFIDYSDFNNPKELFDYIQNMDSLEYLERLNKCINVYNNIANQSHFLVWDSRKNALDAIVNRVNKLID
jgi:alpha(1,3/1,4) fucosyltransferase